MKALKICFYDFRRLIINPITLCGLIVAIVACVIAGFCFSPSVAPTYTLSYIASTADELYENFMFGNYDDSADSLSALIIENENIIRGQQNTLLIENYQTIQTDTDGLIERLRLYNSYPDIYPTESNNSLDVTLRDALDEFYSTISAMSVYECPIYFTEEEVDTIKNLSTLLNNTIYASANTNGIRTMYDVLLEEENYRLLNAFADIEAVNWQLGADTAVALEVDYVVNVRSKLRDILNEFDTVYSDTQDFNTMVNLAINYEQIATLANYNLKAELYLHLSDSIPNIATRLGFENQEVQEIRQAIIRNNYIINEERLYYTTYSSPMNFNEATGSVNAYDFAYYLIAIIGFIMVFIGIFFVYKLFGRDRKKGKVDVVLTQDASFNAVFAGKFLAVFFATFTLLLIVSILIILTSFLIYGASFTPVLAVFNLSSAYVVSPIVYLLFKVLCIEFEVMFFALVTMLLMNVSRKFDLMFGVSLGIYAVSFVMNIFLSGFLVYALLPFAHTNLFSYFGGANSSFGFLNTVFTSGGNFFISLSYILVLMLGLYFFTNQLFKRN